MFEIFELNFQIPDIEKSSFKRGFEIEKLILELYFYLISLQYIKNSIKLINFLGAFLCSKFLNLISKLKIWLWNSILPDFIVIH